LGTTAGKQIPRSDLAKLALAEENESRIWHELTHVQRQISRQAYDALAAQLPHLRATKRGF
jgi:hypothetical protein